MADAMDPEVDAALTSVAAHGMLNSLGVARATISTLRMHGDRIDAETRDRLLSRAEIHLVFLSETLSDLVRGIPGEARQVLDGLPDAHD